jgi:hypothetical protein
LAASFQGHRGKRRSCGALARSVVSCAFIVFDKRLAGSMMRTVVEWVACVLACIGAVVLLYSLALLIVHGAFPEFSRFLTARG